MKIAVSLMSSYMALIRLLDPNLLFRRRPLREESRVEVVDSFVELSGRKWKLKKW